MRYLIAAWLAVPLSRAQARSLEQAYFERLNRARSGEVARVREEYEQLQTLRLACRIQLREKRVPLRCYEALQLESAWHLHDENAARRLRRQLDARCARAAQTLTLPPLRADVKAASRECRAHIAEARKIEEYRGSDPRPDWSGN